MKTATLHISTSGSHLLCGETSDHWIGVAVAELAGRDAFLAWSGCATCAERFRPLGIPYKHDSRREVEHDGRR